jgi:MFS family permease
VSSVVVTAPGNEKASLTRDQRGVLGLIAGGLVVLGLMEGSAGALWPDVIDAFDVSKGAFGFASGVGLCVAFPLLIFGGRITTRFDKRALLGVAAVFMILASLGFTIGHALIALATLLIVRGIGICLIDLASNALAMEVENQTGRHLMSPLHSGFSAGTVAGAGIAWIIFELGGAFRTIYIVLTLLLAFYALLAFRERMLRPFPRTRTQIAGASSVSFALFKRPDIRVLTVITGVSFCGELLIAQWIGIYLRDELGYSTSIGVRAVILLGASMFLGRIVNQPITSRLGARTALLLQGATLTIGGILLVITESANLTIIGCGVAGLGIAGIAPTALSLAGLAVPSDPGAASGAMLMGGYFGVALIPFAAGGIAEIASVRVVLLVEIVFGLVVVLAALGLHRWITPVPEAAADS